MKVPNEEIARLAIENEKADKEESENAPIEMSLLAAGTDKDFEGQELEQQAEAKLEEGDDAQMPPLPPSSEMPGAITSNDIESQEEEQQTEAVLENESKDEKSRKDKKAEQGEESFLFAASVCSTWIPSVVGDPEQRFFLKAGEVFGLSSVCRILLYLAKLPRCCEPRHEECLPCRCNHPRPLWNPQGSSVSSPLC